MAFQCFFFGECQTSRHNTLRPSLSIKMNTIIPNIISANTDLKTRKLPHGRSSTCSTRTFCWPRPCPIQICLLAIDISLPPVEGNGFQIISTGLFLSSVSASSNLDATTSGSSLSHSAISDIFPLSSDKSPASFLPSSR